MAPRRADDERIAKWHRQLFGIRLADVNGFCKTVRGRLLRRSNAVTLVDRSPRFICIARNDGERA